MHENVFAINGLATVCVRRLSGGSVSIQLHYVLPLRYDVNNCQTVCRPYLHTNTNYWALLVQITQLPQLYFQPTTLLLAIQMRLHRRNWTNGVRTSTANRRTFLHRISARAWIHLMCAYRANPSKIPITYLLTR